MKKFLFMALAAFTLITLSQSCKKKLTDEDVTKSAQEALTKAGMDTKVSVAKGVATISGTCKDDKCKADCEATVKGIKGVESVVNSCTVTPPPASLTTALDAPTMQKVKDGMKDIKGVEVSFAGDKVVLAGSITDADRMKVMQMLGAAKLKSDVTKLMKK
jgi:hyperosmotically inducible periplasmic protein